MQENAIFTSKTVPNWPLEAEKVSRTAATASVKKTGASHRRGETLFDP